MKQALPIATDVPGKRLTLVHLEVAHGVSISRQVPVLSCLLQVCLAHPPSSSCSWHEPLSSASVPRDPRHTPCHGHTGLWCSHSSPWLIRHIFCPDAPSSNHCQCSAKRSRGFNSGSQDRYNGERHLSPLTSLTTAQYLCSCHRAGSKEEHARHGRMLC